MADRLIAPALSDEDARLMKDAVAAIFEAHQERPYGVFLEEDVLRDALASRGLEIVRARPEGISR